jgi:hypothetical protein
MDPGPQPDKWTRPQQATADPALLTGEELLALIAGALIRQQQEVIELRDALGSLLAANQRLRQQLDAKAATS